MRLYFVGYFSFVILDYIFYTLLNVFISIFFVVCLPGIQIGGDLSFSFKLGAFVFDSIGEGLILSL